MYKWVFVFSACVFGAEGLRLKADDPALEVGSSGGPQTPSQSQQEFSKKLKLDVDRSMDVVVAGVSACRGGAGSATDCVLDHVSQKLHQMYPDDALVPDLVHHMKYECDEHGDGQEVGTAATEPLCVMYQMLVSIAGGRSVRPHAAEEVAHLLERHESKLFAGSKDQKSQVASVHTTSNGLLTYIGFDCPPSTECKLATNTGVMLCVMIANSCGPPGSPTYALCVTMCSFDQCKEKGCPLPPKGSCAPLESYDNSYRLSGDTAPMSELVVAKYKDTDPQGGGSTCRDACQGSQAARIGVFVSSVPQVWKDLNPSEKNQKKCMSICKDDPNCNGVEYNDKVFREESGYDDGAECEIWTKSPKYAYPKEYYTCKVREDSPIPGPAASGYSGHYNETAPLTKSFVASDAHFVPGHDLGGSSHPIGGSNAKCSKQFNSATGHAYAPAAKKGILKYVNEFEYLGKHDSSYKYPERKNQDLSWGVEYDAKGAVEEAAGKRRGEKDFPPFDYELVSINWPGSEPGWPKTDKKSPIWTQADRIATEMLCAEQCDKWGKSAAEGGYGYRCKGYEFIYAYGVARCEIWRNKPKPAYTGWSCWTKNAADPGLGTVDATQNCHTTSAENSAGGKCERLPSYGGKLAYKYAYKQVPYIPLQKRCYGAPYTQAPPISTCTTAADQNKAGDKCRKPWGVTIGTSVSLGWGDSSCDGWTQKLHAWMRSETHIEKVEMLHLGIPSKSTDYLKKLVGSSITSRGLWSKSHPTLLDDAVDKGNYHVWPLYVILNFGYGNELMDGIGKCYDAKPANCSIAKDRMLTNVAWFARFFKARGARCVLVGGVYPVSYYANKYPSAFTTDLHDLDNKMAALANVLNTAFASSTKVTYVRFLNTDASTTDVLEQGMTGGLNPDMEDDPRHMNRKGHEWMRDQAKVGFAQCMEPPGGST